MEHLQHFDFWFSGNFNCDFGCRTCVNVIKQFIRFCYEVFRRSPSIGLQFGDNMKLNMICSVSWNSECILPFDLLENSICMIFISIAFMSLDNSCDFTMATWCSLEKHFWLATSSEFVQNFVRNCYSSISYSWEKCSWRVGLILRFLQHPLM